MFADRFTEVGRLARLRTSPARAKAGAVTASLIACLVATSVRAEPPRADLVIHASGFPDENGQAIASLFREQDDIFGKPAARVAAPIHQGRATLIFARLPPGDYAVTVFHDENGNGDLDHNLLRLPAEPLGFSNGFSLSVFSGLPSFQKLRFAFGGDTKSIEILVK